MQAAGVELSENQLMDGLNAGKQYVKDLDLLETQLVLSKLLLNLDVTIDSSIDGSSAKCRR